MPAPEPSSENQPELLPEEDIPVTAGSGTVSPAVKSQSTPGIVRTKSGREIKII